MNRFKRPPLLYAAYLACLFSIAVTTLATEPPITCLAFADDGESVVAVSQSGIHVYSWPSLTHEQTVESSLSNLNCLAFSPSGKSIAIGGGLPSLEGIVEVLSWPNFEPITELKGHYDCVQSVAWPDDGSLVTASIDREIKLWSLQSIDHPVNVYKGHSRSVSAVCLLRDGKTLVSAGIDQSVRVWDLESAKPTRSLSQHRKPVHALQLSPAKAGLPMVASASNDHTIRFWQPTIGRMTRYVRLESEPLNIAWIIPSELVASCADGRVRVIDTDKVKVTQSLAAINGWAYAIAVHPSENSVAVGGTDGQLQRIQLGQPGQE